jgi:hypothetical protein
LLERLGLGRNGVQKQRRKCRKPKAFETESRVTKRRYGPHDEPRSWSYLDRFERKTSVLSEYTNGIGIWDTETEGIVQIANNSVV